jgi:hypothetical protein
MISAVQMLGLVNKWDDHDTEPAPDVKRIVTPTPDFSIGPRKPRPLEWGGS